VTSATRHVALLRHPYVNRQYKRTKGTNVSNEHIPCFASTGFGAVIGVQRCQRNYRLLRTAVQDLLHSCVVP
jgi:hypothetical protein